MSIVYQGSEIINFTLIDMPAQARIYVFANGKDITFLATPASGIIGAPLVSDNTGTVNGKLLLPSTGSYKFPAGEVKLLFTDSPNGKTNATRFAEQTLINSIVNGPVVTPDNGLVSTIQQTKISEASSSTLKQSDVVSSVILNGGTDKLYPLTQSFFIDPNKNPYGIFITSIEVLFLQKDGELPVTLEVRTLVNGIPDISKYITESLVTVQGASIVVPDNLSSTNSVSLMTKFKFPVPIFLTPGEYAFSIITKSDKYKLATAKLGQRILDSDTVVAKQPYAGRLFKPQTGGVWEPDLNEDLFFRINKAKFEVGVRKFEVLSPDNYGLLGDSVKVFSKQIEVGEVARISYLGQHKGVNGQYTEQYVMPVNTVVPLYSTFNLKNQGDFKMEVTFDNKSPDITPVIDKEQFTLMTVKNSLFPYESDVSDSELDPLHGAARSRYVSQIVTLNKGFDSTGLNVSLKVNRQLGSDIEVFCRVVSSSDPTAIDDRPFIKMPLVSPTQKTYAGSTLKFEEEIYALYSPNLKYEKEISIADKLTKKSFDTFISYQIKIVFYSGSPGYVTTIKDLVATAVL